MTSTEKQELLSMLSQKEADLQTKLQMTQDERRALEATPVTTLHKVWEPEEEEAEVWYTQDKGQKVWYLCREHNKPFALSLGMVHPNEEAAERHHSFLVMLHDLHKFAVEHNEGWKPTYNQPGMSGGEIIFYHPELRKFSVKYTPYQTSILPYFKTGTDYAQKAIDTFGDRLKILFEYYNS